MCSDPLREGEAALARLDAQAAAEDQLQAEVEHTCTECGGSGSALVSPTRYQRRYGVAVHVTCPRCNGSGRIAPDDSPKPPSDDVEAIADAFSGKEAAKR